MEAPPSQSHADRYRGKNLFFLLLAIGTPAAFLYLRVVFEYAAGGSHLTSAPCKGLLWTSNLSLVFFFIAQLICARYVQRLLKPPVTWPGRALQYVAVLLLCALFSITGAVLLEAFGYAFLLRVLAPRVLLK